MADVFTDLCARHELQTSLIMRGAAGFGAKHHLHTDRQLTSSEDLPVVAVAVDARERIEAILPEVEQLDFDGIVTTERARMLTGRIEPLVLPPELHESTKLTVYVGRHERVGSEPAYRAVVALLHREGIAGATVLLGVDGTAHGARERARFFDRNAAVPMMVISVGDGARIAAVLPELGRMLQRPLVTLERVRICKRDGDTLATPGAGDATAGWQKLTVYAAERTQHEGRPLYRELLRRLRAAGAGGATCLRGVWGFHGDHPPHGDRFWQLGRRVPVLTVIVDVPERMPEWFAIADELTSQTGLVTSEIVPGYRAITAGS